MSAVWMPKTPRLLVAEICVEAPVYRGIDRPLLGRGEIPEALLHRTVALQELAPAGVEAPWRALQADLEPFGRFELVARGEVSGPAWELLGYDVGEDTPAAWSALAHRHELFSPEALAAWEPLLNRHGLFDAGEPAERFLAAYLECEDPDRDWGGAPATYEVVAIHRLREP